jgi:transcriptional regulator with XRE-family HTH domain
MLWMVRLKRRYKKFSLKEMSRQTLITANTLSRIEKDPASARLGDLKKVCDVLELDILEVIKSIY